MTQKEKKFWKAENWGQYKLISVLIVWKKRHNSLIIDIFSHQQNLSILFHDSVNLLYSSEKDENYQEKNEFLKVDLTEK